MLLAGLLAHLQHHPNRPLTNLIRVLLRAPPLACACHAPSSFPRSGASADPRPIHFAEGEELAAEAAHRAGRHLHLVEIGYVAQILTGRLEQGRLDEVIAQLGAMLDSFSFGLPGYRAMRAGALAEAGRLAEASRELDRVGEGVPSSELKRLIGHAPMCIRHVSEVCRRLCDQDRATELLAQLAPWSGQILVGGWGQSIMGGSDRAIGHLLATVGRFNDADTAYTAAADLERSAGFPPLAARTEYWRARALLERNARGDRERARVLLDNVADITGRLGMELLHRQALVSRQRAGGHATL